MEIENNPKQEYITHLQNLLKEEHLNNPGGMIELIDLGSDFEYWQSVAIESGVALGIATVQAGNELSRLYVDPQQRNKKIADKLVSHVMDCLKAEGKTEMLVEMTRNALPFWEKFIAIHQLKYYLIDGQLKVSIKLK